MHDAIRTGPKLAAILYYADQLSDFTALENVRCTHFLRCCVQKAELRPEIYCRDLNSWHYQYQVIPTGHFFHAEKHTVRLLKEVSEVLVMNCTYKTNTSCRSVCQATLRLEAHCFVYDGLDQEVNEAKSIQWFTILICFLTFDPEILAIIDEQVLDHDDVIPAVIDPISTINKFCCHRYKKALDYGLHHRPTNRASCGRFYLCLILNYRRQWKTSSDGWASSSDITQRKEKKS